MAQRIKRLPVMQETRFDPWVGKIPWRRKWQPTPVFLPGESYGQRSMAGYIVHGVAKSQTRLSDFTFTRRCQCAMFESLVYLSGSQSVTPDQLNYQGTSQKCTFLSSYPPSSPLLYSQSHTCACTKTVTVFTERELNKTSELSEDRCSSVSFTQFIEHLK